MQTYSRGLHLSTPLALLSFICTDIIFTNMADVHISVVVTFVVYN